MHGTFLINNSKHWKVREIKIINYMNITILRGHSTISLFKNEIFLVAFCIGSGFIRSIRRSII